MGIYDAYVQLLSVARDNDNGTYFNNNIHCTFTKINNCIENTL